MIRSILLFLAFAFPTTGVLAAPAFVNNSFESGFSGWTLNGSPDIQSFGFDGNASAGGAVFLDGGAFETMSQTLSGFVVGQAYSLSFYQQNNGILLFPYDDGRASWEVLIDGSSAFFSDLMDPGDATWDQQSFNFVAVNTSLTFTFSPFDIDNGAALPGDTGVYPVIDFIELSDAAVVPIPAAVWLLGSALFGLAVTKRKKA